MSVFDIAEREDAVSDEDYKRDVPGLRTELLRVQNELRRQADFSVIAVVGGVDGAGKGDTVNTLFEWLDPRYLVAEAFGQPSEEATRRPFGWRFWRAMPPKGRIAVFFGSWYTSPILRHVYGELSKERFAYALERIAASEKQLTDDGTLLLKFWLHIAKKTQKKQFEKLAGDPLTAWRVTETDRRHHKLYDEFVPACERALERTTVAAAPWIVVDGSDENHRELTVGREVLAALSGRLAVDWKPAPHAQPLAAIASNGDSPSRLATLNLGQKLGKKKYNEKLAKWQGKLNRLGSEAQKRGIGAVLAFEGWDAAGKGGAIRRVTRALDARYYKVVPIAAPSDEERAQHYLWRFWRRLPLDGRMTIFDRSWYGRVLVERVEGYAAEDEWRRAYDEINEFETQLAGHGVALAKFWLHIDADEQLDRFRKREQVPYKQFKITDDDWRNREKRPAYEAAVEEMLARTEAAAPWNPIAANDKRHARVEVVKRVCRALEAAIDSS